MKGNIVSCIRKYGITVVLIVLIIMFSIMSPVFLTVSNLMNIARQVSMIGISAVGMMFVLLIGGIDLSTGAIVSFTNVLAALLMTRMGMSPVLASILCLVLSAGIGLINGLLITLFHIPALIATLATQSVFFGVSYIISGGVSIFGFPESYSILGKGYLWIIPVPVIIMILTFGVGAFILKKTPFGRYFYAIGGNEEASHLSGIKVGRTKVMVYSLAGFFGGISGLIMLSRINSGQAITGKGFEFDVITAVVLGGISVSGGSGKIMNAIVGVLIMGILSTGLTLINLGEYPQMIVKGIVLILAVGFDCVQKYRDNAS